MNLRVPLLIACAAAPLVAQFSGPAILSRGEAPAAMSAPQVTFRPFVEVGALYGNGLTGVTVDSQGQLLNGGSYGLSVGWGVSGVHSWRHTKVGLDYRGSLAHYAQQQSYDYLDQTFLFSVTHQFSPHLSGGLRQSAGIVTRNFGPIGLRQTVPFDPSTAYIPVTDYFDNRTIFLTSQADIEYQRTARLSFVFGGDAYMARRRSHALYGTNGVTARGDTQYRLTRSSTIGAQYMFMHFYYPGISGATDVHGVAGTYGRRITRTVEFSGYAGFMRVESLFLQSAPIDPVIAALLGEVSTQQLVHRINYLPNGAGRISKAFRTGVYYVSGGVSVNPGNGIFLTSRLTTVLTGYSYTGLRRWSFGASAGYERATSISTIVGDYSDTSESMTTSRQIIHNVHAILSFNSRQYHSTRFLNYNRNMNEVRLSVGYSPGDIPLRVW